MNADLIGGIVIGLAVAVIFIMAKNTYLEIYNDVFNLRKERELLTMQIGEMRKNLVRTQEDINDYYEWRKERGKA